MRVAILSHGHPSFSKGGGEIAAYNLFQGLNATGEHEAWFIARAPGNLMHLGTTVAAINDREYLVAGNAEIPDLTATIALGDDSDFAELLRTLKPDVIHFHHYVFLGLELIRAAKRVCPEAKIVLTLHEYIALCMNSGQMIKTDGRLCYQSSPRECAQCFPERTAEDFFLREIYIKSHFRLVDSFISPSEFLRGRYVKWGLPAEKIVVIENGLPAGERIEPRELREDEVRGRFAYFGQINPFKGVDLILEAFSKLPKKFRKNSSLDIYGSGLEWQQEPYRAKVENLLEENRDIVRYRGPYESEELPKLMSAIDWVVMGSIWWENSPVVIQEAFKFGRPVICPDIGGMFEKVCGSVEELTYRRNDVKSLAFSLERAMSLSGSYKELIDKLPLACTWNECSFLHLKLYEQLFGHCQDIAA